MNNFSDNLYLILFDDGKTLLGIDLPKAWDPSFENPEYSKLLHGNVCTFWKDIFRGF